MDASVRVAVWERARHRCEYCQLRWDQVPFAAFHVEHVIPKKHGGVDSLSNLALAWDRCNLHKGANLAGLDPETGELAALFNPRTQRWDDHFRMQGPSLLGRTAVGRVTVQVLQCNAARRLRLRAQLLASGTT